MCRHVANFYDTAFPAQEISEFFSSGLEAGDTCLSLLTASHRIEVEDCMRARGISIEGSSYAAIDVDDAWSKIQVGGRLDMRLARDLLGQLMVPPAGSRTGRVRAAGDLAPMLCAAGNTDDAVAFEGLVHELTQSNGGSTVCVYPIRRYIGSDGVRALVRVSAQHAEIRFPRELWAQHVVAPTRH